jgi:hypothetical protein
VPDAKDPKKGLVGQRQAGFNILITDGSVRTLSAAIDADLLNALFTRDGGERIDYGQLEPQTPGVRRKGPPPKRAVPIRPPVSAVPAPPPGAPVPWIAGKELCQFLGHTTEVHCVAVSPDGRVALSGGKADAGKADGSVMAPDPENCAIFVWDIFVFLALGV